MNPEEMDIQRSKKREAFQAEGTANAKMLWQVHAW